MAWLAFHLRAAAPDLRTAQRMVLGALVGWIVLSTALAFGGYYQTLNADYLLLVIGTAMPILLVTSLALASRDVRALLMRFVDRTPLPALTGVHVVRIAALGTIYKWAIGALPAHFILPVGVPDLLIGLTALSMSRRVSHAGADRLFVAWNAIGAGSLPIAPILIQLSQPGPLRVFMEGPNTDEVLGFPMSIVPTLYRHSRRTCGIPEQHAVTGRAARLFAAAVNRNALR